MTAANSYHIIEDLVINEGIAQSSNHHILLCTKIYAVSLTTPPAKIISLVHASRSSRLTAFSVSMYMIACRLLRSPPCCPDSFSNTIWRWLIMVSNTRIRSTNAANDDILRTEAWPSRRGIHRGGMVNPKLYVKLAI